MGLKTLQELNSDFLNKRLGSAQCKKPNRSELVPDSTLAPPKPFANSVTDLPGLLADLPSGLSETAEELTLIQPEPLADIFFAAQKDGYNKADVDHYINKLREAYQTAYCETQTISSKYESLTRDYQKLKTEKQVGLSAEIITKVLLDAEVLARKNIEDARAKADRIVDQARKNIGRTYEAMGQVVNEARELLVFEVNTKNISSTRNGDGQALGGILNGLEDVAGAESRVSGRACGKF